MPRIIIAIFTSFLLALPAAAQDSIFDDRSDLNEFIWEKMKNRDFISLIQRLGGRDEYTTEQLASINNRFLSIYGRDFTSMAAVEIDAMENGFQKEAIAFWDGLSYAWMFLFTHESAGRIVVINFLLNSDSGPILDAM